MRHLAAFPGDLVHPAGSTSRSFPPPRPSRTRKSPIRPTPGRRRPIHSNFCRELWRPMNVMNRRKRSRLRPWSPAMRFPFRRNLRFLGGRPPPWAALTRRAPPQVKCPAGVCTNLASRPPPKKKILGRRSHEIRGRRTPLPIPSPYRVPPAPPRTAPIAFPTHLFVSPTYPDNIHRRRCPHIRKRSPRIYPPGFGNAPPGVQALRLSRWLAPPLSHRSAPALPP